MKLSTYFEKEIFKTEKRRLEMFVIIVTIAMVSIVAAKYFYNESFTVRVMREKTFISYLLMAVSALISLLLSRLWVSHFAKKGRQLPRVYKWVTILVEFCIPAIWLVVLTRQEASIEFLDSPVVLLYFLMIIVSSLHLNTMLSISLGLLTGIFYVIFAYWALHTYPDNLYITPINYYVRSVLFLLSGACAGLVAFELKKRILASFDHMKEKNDIELLFRQQVSKEVVEALKQKKDYTASMEVSIVFLDIRNFTRKVQGMDPQEVIAFQNQFFSPIITIINKHNGITNQLLGDGLMATFGAPMADANHANSAFAAIMEIFDFVDSTRKSSLKKYNIKIGVGAHSGNVIVGNIGQGMRKQFSVSGIPVIISSRIEQLNKQFKTHLLVSKKFEEKLSGFSFQSEPLGPVEMKGIEEQIEVVKIATNMDMEL